jgi:hypothetical protein
LACSFDWACAVDLFFFIEGVSPTFISQTYDKLDSSVFEYITHIPSHVSAYQEKAGNIEQKLQQETKRRDSVLSNCHNLV